MTGNEYQKEALRTEQRSYWSNDPISGAKLIIIKYGDKERLLQGLMGLNGEAGEAIDLFKKHLFQGHDLDREHMARELGDVAWYLAVSADALGYSLDEIFQMNVEKLRTRYPDGFEADRSIRREDGDE